MPERFCCSVPQSAVLVFVLLKHSQASTEDTGRAEQSLTLEVEGFLLHCAVICSAQLESCWFSACLVVALVLLMASWISIW
jgi:hypothetical protein